jgi:hypothetical protein
MKKILDYHDKYQLRRQHLKNALCALDEQEEHPGLAINEELYIKTLIEEYEKNDSSNYELFASPDVLKNFLENKNKSTLFLSKNGKKKIWKGTRLPKKILDFVQ